MPTRSPAVAGLFYPADPQRCRAEAEHYLSLAPPSARLLPIMVPVTQDAPQVGRVVAEQAQHLSRRAMFFGSSDLTHYGPRYGFAPHGLGAEGLRWAREENDRRLLDLLAS